MGIPSGISLAFLERITSIGIDRERLLDFISLFSDNARGEKERNKLDEIIRDMENCSNLEKISSDQSIFLDQLFEKNLGIKIFPYGVETLSKKLIAMLSRVVAFAALFVTLAFLFSAILDGHSSNKQFASMPIVASVIFVVLILILYLLEGTQICITTLRLKDLEHLRTIDSKSYEFHKNYRYLDRVNEYLAGRQLFTIFCVFTISQIATFPELNRIPFTDVQFSDWVDKWLATPLLDLGFLGAIFTLWIGQLTPQFVSARQPVNFMRSPFAKLIVSMSCFINKLGVSVVPTFFAGQFKSEPEIPTSNREKLLSFKERHGYAGLGLSLQWRIKKDQITFRQVEEIEFFTQQLDLLKVIQTIPTIYKAGKLASTFNVNRSGQFLNIGIVDMEEHHEFDSYVMTSRVSPKHGRFLTGDILSSSLDLNIPRVEMISHAIRPILPTRYLSIEIIVDEDVGIMAPRILVSESEFLSEGGAKETELAMDQIMKKNQSTRFHRFMIFPDSDTEYKVVWRLH